MNQEFIKAAGTGDTNKVRLLLTNPEVNPAARDYAAIWWASSNGHTEVVRLLLADPRVDPAANNNYAIRNFLQGIKYKQNFYDYFKNDLIFISF